MLRLCGKHVRRLGKVRGESTEQLSTESPINRSDDSRIRAQVADLHTFTQHHPHHMSTILIRNLPLGEHYFYPLSTAPTITSTKGKLKKGSI